MSVTIATLGWANDSQFLHTIVRDTYSWLGEISVIDGWKGKCRISNFGITGALLEPLACDLNTNALSLDAKDVTVNQYKISLPVEQCDLNQTWLSAFASKYQSNTDVYLDNLMPYIAESVGDQLKEIIKSDMLVEAGLDANVTKVAVTASAGTGQGVYDAILEFIAGFTDEFTAEALEAGWWGNYVIAVDPVSYTLLAGHLSDKTSGGCFGLCVGGFEVVADRILEADIMYCTPQRNILAVFDAVDDLYTVKIVSDDFKSTDYIVGGLGVGGSYIDSKKITITS